jgi:hypothetical protein
MEFSGDEGREPEEVNLQWMTFLFPFGVVSDSVVLVVTIKEITGLI